MQGNRSLSDWLALSISGITVDAMHPIQLPFQQMLRTRPPLEREACMHPAKLRHCSIYIQCYINVNVHCSMYVQTTIVLVAVLKCE